MTSKTGGPGVPPRLPEDGTEGALAVPVLRDDFGRLSEFVREVLRYNIASGSLKPGNRLVERDLAEKLDVSRVPVREAVHGLAEEGLVELRPHGRGAVVSEGMDSLLRDFFEVRTGLECWAAHLAAERRQPTALVRLDEICDRGLAKAESGDYEASLHLGRQWHDELALASGNKQLVRLLASHDAKLAWRSLSAVGSRGTSTWLEHRAIANALKEGDGVEAARLVRYHMRQHERMQVMRFTELPSSQPAI